MDLTMVAVDGPVAIGDVATVYRRQRLPRPAGGGGRHHFLRAADWRSAPECLAGTRGMSGAGAVSAPRGDHRPGRTRHRASARQRRLRRRGQRHARQRGSGGRWRSTFPNLAALGLGGLRAARRNVPRPRPPGQPTAICEPASAGKDSTTGHWETLRPCTRDSVPDVPIGTFRPEVIAEFCPPHRPWRARQPAGVGHASARRLRCGASAERAVDRLHLGRQRLSGGGARGDGPAGGALRRVRNGPRDAAGRRTVSRG